MIGHLLGDVDQAAIVIAVVVRQPEVVDLLHARELQHLENPIQVALAGVAGVHEQRLPGGRYEQRGLAAFGVDVIDVEGLACLCLRGRRAIGIAHTANAINKDNALRMKTPSGPAKAGRYRFGTAILGHKLPWTRRDN